MRNASFGEMNPACRPIVFDKRHDNLRGNLLIIFPAQVAGVRVAGMPRMNTGVWQIRTKWQLHFFITLLAREGLGLISLGMALNRIHVAEVLLRNLAVSARQFVHQLPS